VKTSAEQAVTPALPEQEPAQTCATNGVGPETRAFYCRTIEQLKTAGVPFLVGGAFALYPYTGIERNTKDFDIFVKEADRDRALEALAALGCRTEIPFPHWLAKAYCDDGRGDFVDVIYSSGNGVARVDDEWFEHAVEGDVLGCRAPLCPPEETIWSKAFVMERERYDGADVAHLLHKCADALDWQRLLRRFGPNWRVLMSHLVMFGFIYPTERARIPAWLMDELMMRLRAESGTNAKTGPLCQGTLISREQYLIDVNKWGYRDARLAGRSSMDEEEVEIWTEAIGTKK
jgi:hypothetical protein